MPDGGRIVGEACHFVDLARYLIGAPIVATHGFAMGAGEGRLGDCVAIQLQFSDGSLATIHYLANGSKDFPMESIRVLRVAAISSGATFVRRARSADKVAN